MDELKLYLSILIEEYKSLRDESKQASINMFSALSWGTGILGIIMSIGFTQWDKQPVIVLLIFYIIIPIIAAISMFFWLSEAIRLKRAGDYICLIEQKVKIILNEFKQYHLTKAKWLELQEKIEESIGLPHSSLDLSSPLVWEQWLRDMNSKKTLTGGHFVWIYIIKLAIFPLLMFSSFLIGTYYVISHPKLIPKWAVSLEKFTLETEIIIVIFMLSSILIIVLSIITAYRVGRRLVFKTNPFVQLYKKV